MKTTSPVALIVDDEPMHNQIVEAVLRKLGVTPISTSNAKDFLAQLKEKRPDICLVDLNLDDLGVGYTLIKAVRNVLGSALPIFVLSGSSDNQAIAHALEVGANDFVTKPLSRDILASKLARYLKTDELLASRPSFFPVPEGGSPAQVEIQVTVKEIDEFGIKILSPHLLNKGTIFHFDGPLVYEITGIAQPQLMTVATSWLEADGGSYGAFAEFDLANKDLMLAVRRFLSRG